MPSKMWTIVLVSLFGSFQRSTSFNPTNWVDSPAGRSMSHAELTETALFRATAKLFNEMAVAFKPETPLAISERTALTPEAMFQAYYGRKVSTSDYISAVETIYKANARVDFDGGTRDNPVWHFSAEKIHEANRHLMERRAWLYQAVDAGDYITARQLCGQLLHGLQDFYSHTNWVENGRSGPYFLLGIGPVEVEVASEQTVTCVDCTAETDGLFPIYSYICSLNIAASVTKRGVLTSGYHSNAVWNSEEVEKPVGKCSHGGILDDTSHVRPLGGINKDTLHNDASPHHYLHQSASRLAAAATLFFLDGLRESLGLEKFAEFLNINIGRSLTIVMDTTGSMERYIEAAKRRCMELIRASKNDSEITIKNYVLVPFNDPKFGPVMKTDNPLEFEEEIGSLEAHGGGDVPEMSLSGVLLAARASQERSAIYLFTDAPPKDAALFTTVTSVMLENQQSLHVFGEFLNGADDIYREIALATGGEVLLTGSSARSDDLFEITAWITGSMKSSTVALLKVDGVTDLGRNFDVFVDSLLMSVDVLIGHGKRVPDIHFAETARPSLIIDTATTKLYRFTNAGTGFTASFNVTSGLPGWHLDVKGQSHFDVVHGLWYLDNSKKTSHPGLQALVNNPIIGDTLTLLLTSSCSQCLLKQVRLLGSTGSIMAEYALSHDGTSNNYLARIIVPALPFYLYTTGSDEAGGAFQRVSSTQIVPSPILLTVRGGMPNVLEVRRNTSTVLELILFNVGPPRRFLLQVSDTLGFISRVSLREITIPTNGSVTGTVTLKIPTNANFSHTSDMEIVVGILGGKYQANYVRTKILVAEEYQQYEPPSCVVLSSTFEENCNSDQTTCESHNWSAQMEVSHRGRDIHAVRVTMTGVGNFTWSADNFTDITDVRNGSAAVVGGNGSCCLEKVTFSVVDQLGFTGRCEFLRQDKANGSSGLSAGAIAGITVACFVVTILLSVSAAWIFSRSRKLQKASLMN